ncbi:unnamed protein product [Rotaria sordida]|uniref:Uncharacterized protein n=1 Tax=Rotaria sordida TaxID=392033 RepID=A0A815VMT6_9BILA|nr:unnamed protein product [Rotaria sordida]
MRKSRRGAVVLSACQIQATRLNKLEYRRLQRNVTLLHDDLESHIARIHRQEQGLRYHFTNVVRVIKPIRAYQAWKQVHAHEIAQDEAKELIESIKLRQKKIKPILRKQTTSSSSLSNEISSKPLRPLLLLLENEREKPSDPVINLNENLFRPKTSPINKQLTSSHRINPLLNMLDGRPTSSNNMIRQQIQQQSFDTSSFYSFSSMGTSNPRKLIQGKFVTTHKESDLDALYRMALQNQTAYKSVEQKRIEERKLYDKEFASQYRALKGSMRSVGFTNKIN